MTTAKWLLIGALALLSACGGVGPNKAKGEPRPVWINEPGDGVSASAGFHVRGAQAQEELAVSRAREEFAKRYGVKVSSEAATSQLVVGDRMSSVSAKDIHEEVENKEVKATVKAKWRDPETDVLWIWLVPAK
jgi:hypothetical protein